MGSHFLLQKKNGLLEWLKFLRGSLSMFETAIVISIFILAMVILFAVTKDRWNWKKGVKRTSIWSAGCIALVCGGLYCYSKISNRPEKQIEYFGIKLSDSMNEVKFKKGECTETYDVKDDHNTNWIYDLGSNDQNDEKYNFYVVMWKNARIKAVDCSASYLRNYFCGNINNVMIGNSTNEMTDKLGNDFEIASSKDNTKRCYSYKKLNSFYMLKEDTVFSMGIYNPEFGNIKFKD